MNWKNMIEDFLTRSIDLYVKYYMSGELENVSITLHIEDEDAEIIIEAGGESEDMDFDQFRSVSEENERDAQRECYFENESIWMDYLMSANGDEDSIKRCMSDVAVGLSAHYGVDVVIQVE